MPFNWNQYRDAMINSYHGKGGRPCEKLGRHGEDYSNTCAMRHSLSTIKAGHSIDNSIASGIAPGGFFTYAGECNGDGADGKQLARGAANWWAYLVRSGLSSNGILYEAKRAPASISDRDSVPILTMDRNASYDTVWLDEGELTSKPARVHTVDFSNMSSYLAEADGKRKALLDEYEDLSRTWGEFFSLEEKKKRYIVMEGVWPRLLRKYIFGEIDIPRGFVYYYTDDSQDHGFHIDGFDLEYFLDGHHNHPVFGSDYSDSSQVSRVYIGFLAV